MLKPNLLDFNITKDTNITKTLIPKKYFNQNTHNLDTGNIENTPTITDLN